MDRNFLLFSHYILCWVTFKCGFKIISFTVSSKFVIYADITCISIDLNYKKQEIELILSVFDEH